MTLYSCKTSDGSYRLTKFDNDLNPEASYLTSPEACECPAGVRSTCRHRQMLPEFIAQDAVDSPMMYDFERREWVDTSSFSGGLEFNDLALRPFDPAVNELADLAGATELTEADRVAAYNSVADALGQPEAKLALPIDEAELNDFVMEASLFGTATRLVHEDGSVTRVELKDVALPIDEATSEAPASPPTSIRRI